MYTKTKLWMMVASASAMSEDCAAISNMRRTKITGMFLQIFSLLKKVRLTESCVTGQGIFVTTISPEFLFAADHLLRSKVSLKNISKILLTNVKN